MQSDDMGVKFICKLCEFNDLAWIMIAWFLYSDAVETSTLFVVLLWELYDFKDTTVILLSVYLLLPIGTVFFSMLKEKTSLSFISILQILLCCMSCVFIVGFYTFELNIFWSSFAIGGM